MRSPGRTNVELIDYTRREERKNTTCECTAQRSVSRSELGLSCYEYSVLCTAVPGIIPKYSKYVYGIRVFKKVSHILLERNRPPASSELVCTGAPNHIIQETKPEQIADRHLIFSHQHHQRRDAHQVRLRTGNEQHMMRSWGLAWCA